MYCLPWQNREGWGVEDISHVRWGSHSGPRSPSCSEDLASGRWGGGFPISHSLLCFSAFLQTFPASVWFHLPFVPLRSQPPILVWEISMKALTFHSGGGVFFQELTSCLWLPQIWGKMSPQCAQIPFWSSLWQLIQNCLPTIVHEIDISLKQYLHLWNNDYKMGLGFNAGWREWTLIIVEYAFLGKELAFTRILVFFFKFLNIRWLIVTSPTLGLL